MSVAFWSAAFAGLIGGALMAVMRTLMRGMGIKLELDIPRLWGTMLGLHGDLARVVGLVVHLVGSAAIGLIYAWAFALLGARDGLVLWGLLGGAIHWVLAGLSMAIVPPLHPQVPERIRAPGAFVRHLGSPDVPTFVVGHLLYGVVVSILYGLLHPQGGLAAVF